MAGIGLATQGGLERRTSGITAPTTAQLGDLSTYLEPANPAYVARCREEARLIPLNILCPLVLPKGPCDQDAHTAAQNITGAVFVGEDHFIAPHDYQGPTPGSGHFVIVAMRQGQGTVIRPCFAGIAVGRIESGGRRWQIWHCGTVPPNAPLTVHRRGHRIVYGGEIMSGHLVFVTLFHHTSVEVSLHHVSTLNRRLLMAITAHMLPVTFVQGWSGRPLDHFEWWPSLVPPPVRAVLQAIGNLVEPVGRIAGSITESWRHADRGS